MQIGCGGIPHRNAIGAGVVQVKIGGGGGGLEEKTTDLGAREPRTRVMGRGERGPGAHCGDEKGAGAVDHIDEATSKGAYSNPLPLTSPSSSVAARAGGFTRASLRGRCPESGLDRTGNLY